MVGRKISAAEKEERGLRFEETHNVSSAVFHESGEQFTEAIQKDEGTVKHFARHFYMPILMLGCLFFGLHLYQKSSLIMFEYEDYLDWVVFDKIKRGYRLEKIARMLYKADMYSIESRTN